MSCEKFALVCNESFRDIFPKEWHDIMIFKQGDENDLANKIIKLSKIEKEKKELIGSNARKIVIEKHSFSSLINRIINFLK